MVPRPEAHVRKVQTRSLVGGRCPNPANFTHFPPLELHGCDSLTSDFPVSRMLTSVKGCLMNQ